MVARNARATRPPLLASIGKGGAGVRTRELEPITSGPRQTSSLNFALCIDLPFLFFLDFGTGTSNPPPPQPPHTKLHQVKLLPLPFWFCCWVWEGPGEVEDLAHASPPPPCHLKGSSPWLPALWRAQNQIAPGGGGTPAFVCTALGQEKGGEPSPLVLGTPSPGLLGFQVKK